MNDVGQRLHKLFYNSGEIVIKLKAMIFPINDT